MAIKRFSSSFKTRDDVFDSITPNNVVQPNVAAPAGEWKPARYLPVQWTGSASKDAFTISSGKVVCLDNQGRVADMCLSATAAGAAHGDTLITYDSTDAAYGVYNIATGAACTAGDAPTLAETAKGLLDQGLVIVGQDVAVATSAWANNLTFDVGNTADCRLVLAAFFSEPVGVAAYDVYVWAGDTPDELVFTNYQKQHLVQFLTQVQMRAPVIAAASATTLNATGGSQRTQFTLDAANAVAAGDYIEGSDLKALSRYSSVNNSNILGIVLNVIGAVSKNTDRTPLTEASSYCLLSEKTSIEQLSQLGDYYLDHEVGVLILWAEAGAFSVTGLVQASIPVLSFYAQIGASAIYRHIHCVGPIRPGDKLSYDDQSNFCKMAGASDALGSSNAVSIGRALEVASLPKGLLDRVTTAFSGSSFDATAQMPGSATKGYSDMITLSGESVADQIVTINLKV